MKILIVGFGSIGKRHFCVLKELFSTATIHVVSRQNLPGVSCVYCDLRAVPDLSIYDYFVVCSETEKHYEQFLFLEDRVNNKTMLMEKPLFSSYKDLPSTNNKWHVGYNLRYHPVIEYLYSILEKEKILSVQIYAGQYLPQWRPESDYTKSYSTSKLRGGGVLLDLSHEIDYAIKLFGKYKSMMGLAAHISSLAGDSEDYASYIGVTDKNIIVTLTLDYLSQSPQRKIIIQGEGVTIIADIIANSIVRIQGSQIEYIDIPKISDRNQTYTAMHESVLLDDKRSCTLQESLEILKTIDKIKAEKSNEI